MAIILCKLLIVLVFIEGAIGTQVTEFTLAYLVRLVDEILST